MKAYQVIVSCSKYVGVDLSNIKYFSSKEKVYDFVGGHEGTAYVRDTEMQVDAEWLDCNIMENVFVTLRKKDVYFHITEIDID